MTERPSGDPTEQQYDFQGITVPIMPEYVSQPVTPIAENLMSLQDYAYFGIQADIKEVVTKAADLPEDVKLVVKEPHEGIDADFAIPCQPLAKQLRKNPVEIAQEIAGKINAQEDTQTHIAKATAVNGFLNIEVDMHGFGNEILREIEITADDFGEQNIGNGEVVVIDCSSPNIAKFMSVAHLRSTVIGESVARLYQFASYEVIRDNHLGDWGTQFGLLGRAVELWGDEIPKLKDESTAVQGLYQLYVKINNEIAKQKEEDTARKIEQGIPEDEIIPESELEEEGRAWFAKLEQGDLEAKKLLERATSLSLVEFQRIYDLLGVKFETMIGESFFVEMLPEIMQQLQDKGVAHKDKEGAIAVDMSADKLDSVIIQKTDGTSLYHGRDIATLVARTAWFNPAKVLYVVGNEQDLYFRQLFYMFEKLSEKPAPQMEHVGFGKMDLPGGKMSTREGRVVFLEDFLTESIAKAKEKIEESPNDLTPEEVERISRQVGVGAVIYFDLAQGRERKIKFEWDKALSLEGSSAPYIQYQHARTQSVLRLAAENGIEINSDEDSDFELEIEKELVKQLGKFPDVVAKSVQDNKPSHVSQYLLKTATLFSKFYDKAAIVVEKDEAKRNSRLRITQATGQVIRNGLYLLGIEAPDKM